MATLTPPNPTVLEAPAPVEAVKKEEAASMVPVTDDQRKSLDLKVDEFINIVINSEVNSDAFQDKLKSIHNMGNDKIRESASLSNRLLERPVQAMNNGIMDESTQIGQSLLNLRKTVEDLDPSSHGDLLSSNKLFGLIPFGNKLRDYFLKYQSSQSHINSVIQSLYNGQDELKKDNATIELEKQRLWDTMSMLEQYAYVGKEIDKALETRITEIESAQPEKARIVKEEMLFYVRQKVQDLLTQLAVSVQGYMALDLIRKNNLELIKGVDRATTTTVSALRTAVTVAQALANQKLVLQQIEALNETTNSLIANTAKMMRQQADVIKDQAVSPSVKLEVLQSAFSDIYATFDMMSDYKIQALDSMQKTVDSLSSEIEKSKTYLDKVREKTASEQTADLGNSSEINI